MWGVFFSNFLFSRIRSSAFTAFQFLIFLLNPGMERYQMDSQSLSDVPNKCLSKGRCCPGLPWNIPWDLESCSLDSGITLFLQLSHGEINSQCEAASSSSSFHRHGTALPGPPHIVSHFWVYFPFSFFKDFLYF